MDTEYSKKRNILELNPIIEEIIKQEYKKEGYFLVNISISMCQDSISICIDPEKRLFGKKNINLFYKVKKRLDQVIEKYGYYYNEPTAVHDFYQFNYVCKE